jgi:hypothetical protein
MRSVACLHIGYLLGVTKERPEMSGEILWKVEVLFGQVFRMTGRRLFAVRLLWKDLQLRSNLQVLHPAGFLVYFESELLKRAHKNFDFRNGRSVEAVYFLILVTYTRTV